MLLVERAKTAFCSFKVNQKSFVPMAIFLKYHSEVVVDVFLPVLFYLFKREEVMASVYWED